MKVSIKYTELQYFENTIEVEMTKKEYKEYLKKDKFQQEQQFDFCAKTSTEHHVSTETVSIDVSLI